MTWRTFMGFLLAPVVPCTLFVLVMSSVSDQWGGTLFMLLAMLAVSACLSLVVALPIYLALKRFWKVRMRECVLSGVLVAVLVNAVGLIWPVDPGYSAGDSGGPTIVNGQRTPHGYASAFVGTLSSSAFGATIGLCFWLFAIRPTSMDQKR
jgi:hypothetical protein